jgi:transcriptional regulator with XRE-family HTH domain
MNKIGEQLKIKGLKQKWLADQLGMTSVMISLYVQNKRQPKLETLLHISRILNVEVNKLIDSKKT